MKLTRKRGDTSNIFQIFVQDSSSTTGAGLTGLVFNSASLTAYYHKDTDTTATAITLVTMTVGTFTSSGFKEIDATNMSGWYQFCPPDAALSSSGTPHSVGFHLKGAANMAPLAIEVQLVAFDVEDTVRLGLTALPNAAAEAAGGLYTRGSGAGQINQAANGNIDANTVKVGGTTQTARDLGLSVLLSAGTGTGQLDFTSGVTKANATQWLGGTIPAVNVTGVPLVDLKYTLGTLSPAAAGSVGIDWAQVANKTSTVGLTNTTVGTLTTYTGNTVQTGDAYARLGAPVGASISADIAEVEGETDTLLAGVTVTTNNDKTGYLLAADQAVNVTKWNGGAVVAPNVTGIPLVDVKYTLGTLSAGAAGSVGIDWAQVANKTSTVGLSGTTIGTLTTYTGNTVQTGDSYARLGAPAGVSIAADLAEIEGETDLIATGVTVATNNDKTGYSLTSGEENAIADALLDRSAAVETGITFRQAMRYITAACAGLASGLNTTTAVYQNPGGTKNRITATVDSVGNRSTITLDGS